MNKLLHVGLDVGSTTVKIVILDENLKRMGLDINWINKELNCQGYKNAKEILLGICDNNHQLTLFEIN